MTTKTKTVKQHNNDVLVALRDWDGFNNANPEAVVRLLLESEKFWKRIDWDINQDDTLYITPKKSRIAQLECMMAGYKMNPDEVWMTDDGIVRIWWD